MSARLRTGLLGLRTAAITLTVALGLCGLFKPIPFGLAVRLWLVGLAALGAGVFLREARAPHDPVFIPRPRLWRSRTFPKPRPGDLGEIERAILFSTWSAFDVRFRLTPILEQVAAQRLAGRRGVNLETEPRQAREILGEPLWELIRPQGPLPARDAPGMTTAQVRLAIERLEAI